MSQREAFGIAPLEAASAGARVILSDIPAHREIVEDFLVDGSAVVVAGGSTGALATEICRQLACPREQSAHVPDWCDVTYQTIEVYRSAAAGRAVAVPSNETVHIEEIVA
jgi:glycosyltransferase involved in cell wall biosynthesis